MRAKVSKNDILPAVMRTVSIADRKSIVPILSHVLLEFNESGLCIKATDLDHSIIEKIPAEVDINDFFSQFFFLNNFFEFFF